MAAFNPIDDPAKAAAAFDNVFRATLAPAYKLQDFLTPQELAAAQAAPTSLGSFVSNAGTDNQFFNLGALQNAQKTTDPVAKIQAVLDSATQADIPKLLQQYGISQNSWDGYNTNRLALANQLSTNATDTSLQHLSEYLAKQGVNINSMDELNAIPAEQKQKLINDWLSTVKAERESGGWLDQIMSIAGTAAGISTGNPWLGAIAGGLSSGLSTGDPISGLLGAAGGYLGASGVANAGGIGNYINNIGSGIGDFISHPIDSITSAAGGLYDAITHPVDTITNGILGTQNPAPIVDHSINIPTDNIFAGGGFNGSGPLASLAGSGGNTGIDNLVSSAIGGQTPIMGIGTGALSGGQQIGGSQGALSNINVPTQAANKATNALSNVAQNLAGNAITSALTDTPTAASGGTLGGGVNAWKPGILGVTYPGLKSASPFYKGKIGLLGSYV